jgi:hypothetical protein
VYKYAPRKRWRLGLGATKLGGGLGQPELKTNTNWFKKKKTNTTDGTKALLVIGTTCGSSGMVWSICMLAHTLSIASAFNRNLKQEAI